MTSKANLGVRSVIQRFCAVCDSRFGTRVPNEVANTPGKRAASHVRALLLVTRNNLVTLYHGPGRPCALPLHRSRFTRLSSPPLRERKRSFAKPDSRAISCRAGCPPADKREKSLAICFCAARPADYGFVNYAAWLTRVRRKNPRARHIYANVA